MVICKINIRESHSLHYCLIRTLN